MTLRVLIDADLPRSTQKLFADAGHDAVDVRDIGVADAPDPSIAKLARAEGRVLVTGDFGFADVRNYPPSQYPGIVVIQVPRHASAPAILQLVGRFLEQISKLDGIAGRLAIVEAGRIRLRN